MFTSNNAYLRELEGLKVLVFHFAGQEYRNFQYDFKVQNSLIPCMPYEITSVGIFKSKVKLFFRSSYGPQMYQ